MDAPILIRPASPDDAAALVPLIGELGYDVSTEILQENLRRLAQGPTDRVWVAESEAGIVGLVSVHLTPLFHAAGYLGRITALVVREGSRGSGIGSELMREAVAFCWAAGCERVELTSGDHRPEAHRFYEKAGFAIHSRRFLIRRPRE